MNEPTTRVDVSDVTFESTALSGLSEQSAYSIRESDVVVLPYPHLRSHGLVFTHDLAALLAYMDASAPGLRVWVAADEVAPAELVLHGDFFDLGHWLTKDAALPILLGVLSNFIWSRLGPNGRRHDEARVRCDIHVEAAGQSSTQVHYDGPAPTFEKTILELLQKRAQP